MPQITITLAGVATILIVAACLAQFATDYNSKWAMWLSLAGGLCLAGAGALGQALQNVVASATHLTDKAASWLTGASGIGGVLVLGVLVYWFWHRAVYRGDGIRAGQKTKSKHMSRGMQLMALCTCIALGTAIVTTATVVHDVLQNGAEQVSAFLN